MAVLMYRDVFVLLGRHSLDIETDG